MTSTPSLRTPLPQRARPTFHVTTNVWGAHHTELFINLTLPNVLSKRNLPALAQQGDVHYRIFTTPSSKDQIQASKAGQQLAALLQVEFLTPLGDRAPASIWHIHWFHRAAAEAKIAGAVAIFVPPDTLWTDGALQSIGEHMAAGKRGVACPFVLVTSDTCIADARTRFLDPDVGTLTIAPDELWPLARRHMHPNQALAMPGSPHSRPVFEMHWPVRSNGMVSSYAIRELVAFDPRRCPITHFWYADGPEDADGIHFASDPADMFMLSVDPIEKYMQNYILDHSAQPLDIARTTIHPLNNTKQTRVFLSRQVKIHQGDTPGFPWRRRERLARAAARDIRVGRAAMLICTQLVDHGCTHMADLLSTALVETSLSRRWRKEVPLTVFAARDSAFSRTARLSLLEFLRCGRERELLKVILDHVVEGHLNDKMAGSTLAGTPVRLGTGRATRTFNGANIVFGPIDLEGVDLYILDGVAADSLASLAHGPIARRLHEILDPPRAAARGFASKLRSKIKTKLIRYTPQGARQA
jgi:uncharacterized surface protein with fasciclin (FAS1) repeats